MLSVITLVHCFPFFQQSLVNKTQLLSLQYKLRAFQFNVPISLERLYDIPTLYENITLRAKRLLII